MPGNRFVMAVLFLLFAAGIRAEEPVQELVKKAVDAAGGLEKIPLHFAWKEEYFFGDSQTAHPRTAVLHSPDHWFQSGKDIAEGDTDRSEKTYLASLWTLRPLLDPQVKLAAMPAVDVDGKPAWGVKVSRDKRPDISLYFFQDTSRLARIDWRTYSVFFAEWKECDGFKYPSQAFVKHRDGKPHVRTVFKSFTRVDEDVKIWPEGK